MKLDVRLLRRLETAPELTATGGGGAAQTPAPQRPHQGNAMRQARPRAQMLLLRGVRAACPTRCRWHRRGISRFQSTQRSTAAQCPGTATCRRERRLPRGRRRARGRTMVMQGRARGRAARAAWARCSAAARGCRRAAPSSPCGASAPARLRRSERPQVLPPLQLLR